MGTSFFICFMGSLIICMALIPALAAFAGRLQFVDIPRERHAHEIPIAKVGGIAFAFATFAAILLWGPEDRLILSSLLGGLVIVLFGVWDDRIGLNPSTKFIGQALAAGIVIGLAGVRFNTLPFMGGSPLAIWIAIPLTLLVIVGMTNAVNLADGLDGLAGGLSLLSFAGIAYLAYQAGDQMLVVLMVAVLGSLLGFLRFNTYPARVFMGDAGSQFLGHYLAVAALILIDPARAPYSPLIILVFWGVPLLDTLGVMGQRLAEGRSPFVGDRNHIHHKLLAIGLTHRQAVTSIYMTQGLSVCLAYLLRWQTDGVVLLAYLVFAGIVLSLFVLAPRLQSISTDATAPPQTGFERNLTEAWMHGWPLQALKWLVPVYLAVCVFIPREIPNEAALIGIGLLAAVVGTLLAAKGSTLAIRIGLYIGITFIMYYSEVVPRFVTHGGLTPLNAGFVFLGLLVILTIRLTDNERFQTTPLDYLIVSLALVLPFLPDLVVDGIDVGALSAKLIILFFAFELLLQVSRRIVAGLGWLTAWMLAGLVVRAWWP